MFDMERSLYKKLVQWKNKVGRKPLILNGARQVGKTYLLQEFGRREYEKVAFFSLDRNAMAVKVFEQGGKVDDILMSLSAINEVDITPGNTLVVLDEVQDCPKALETLKYICEDAGDYHVVVAGSLLGLSLHDGVSYPVGKVEELRLYPMTFVEFLQALGKNRLADTLIDANWTVINMLAEEYVRLLRQYYFVGGMPEAVKAYIERGDVWEVRSIHTKIIEAYRNDMSKHAPLQQVQRINMVWNSIPSQLARDNKKFVYGALKKGARANDFEIAIQWLVDSGLVHKVYRINKPTIPLKFYEDMSAFKLFLLDCGLLGALSETPPQQILIGDNVFEEYKGAFTENYVLQQLKSIPHTFVYYYSNENSTMEIDFVVQHDNEIIPVEVKAEENLRAKSLRQFTSDNPGLHGMRFSMSGYREQEWLTNVPLWAVKWSFT